MRCISSCLILGMIRAKPRCKSLCGKPSWLFELPLEADFCVGTESNLLVLGTVLSTRRLSLYAFEYTPLSSNVKKEFGNRSSFKS